MEPISKALELNDDGMSYLAMCLRTIIVFALVLFIVRVGSRRFISKLSAFDMLVAIMIGSIGSRAITGNSSFGPSLASIAVLVALHWLFASVCFHTKNLGLWLKGEPIHLVKDGELQKKELCSTRITIRDLEEAMRSSGLKGGVDQIQEAWQERDGSISIIKRDDA